MLCMKKILIFSLTYHPFVGGAEVAIKEITDRLPEFEFHMVTLRFDSSLPRVDMMGNITVYRIGPSIPNATVSDRTMPFMLRLAKWTYPLNAALTAFVLHRSEQYDMTWSMMANHAGFAGMFFKLFHPRVPHMLELQDGRAFNEMKERQPILRLLWPLYARVYRCANAIKVISNFLDGEVKKLGVSAPVHIIPNGVDVAKFSAAVPDETITDLRNKFGKKMGDVILFTASRLVLSRGVEDTIRALTHLPEHVKFVIAGTGDDKQKLEDIARESGVFERVQFVGHVDHGELPAYYKASDIFVRPSIIEGFGNAFVEAFAAGIPVIATPVGGIPDFLFDPERNPDKSPTGLFCDVRNPKSIADAVTRFIENPALVAEVVANAKALVAETYDWNSIAKMQKHQLFDVLTAK
jgi:glycosyltransferase involved in cell wall biosynthesis